MKAILKKIVSVFRALFGRKVVIACDSISYVFEHVPYPKIFNWLAVEFSMALRPLVPWGWPTHVQFEPANCCNLRCALCPITGAMRRDQTLLDPALFRKFLDEVGDYLFLLLFWDWGEPFMNPHFFTMVAEAKQKNIRVVTSTNGHMLGDPGFADRLIKSGLDTLIVAVDGLTQKTYERYRQGGSLDKVFKGIRALVERKKALGSRTPLVNFRFIVMQHNEHEVPRLREVVRDLGVDVLTLKTLNPCADNTYGEKKGASDGKQHEMVPRDPRFQRFRYDKKTGLPLRRKRNLCKNPWNAPTIHVNGVVCPCTYDYDERFPLGDLKKQSFKDIWQGGPYRRMRRRIREQDPDFHFCYECSYSYVGGSCIDETIVAKHVFGGEAKE